MKGLTFLEENKLSTTPIRRLIVDMSWPMMLSMLVQALYNMVDSYYVSLADPKGFLALSFVFPAQSLMIAICVGTGVGVNAMLSRRLGEKRPEEASAVAENGYFVYFLTWLVYLLLGVTLGPRFVGFFSSDPQVVAYGGQYLTIVLCGSIGMCMQFAGERVLQASGQPVGPMIIQGIGAVINLVLDPILIFGLGPFPVMGVAGAAIATVFGQLVGMCVGFFLVHRKPVVKLSFRKFRPDMAAIRDIYRIGMPAMAMQSLGTFMTLGLNKILVLPSVTAAAGDAPVFVLGAYFKLQSFVFMPVAGLNNGLTPVLSYNYGAKHRRRIVEGLHFALKLALVIMGLGTLIFQLFPASLLAIFSTPAGMMETGVFALRIISVTFLCAGATFIFSGAFQALGSPNLALILGLTRQIVIVLPVCLILALTDPALVWFCFPAAEIISCLLAVFFYRRLRLQKIDRMADA